MINQTKTQTTNYFPLTEPTPTQSNQIWNFKKKIFHPLKGILVFLHWLNKIRVWAIEGAHRRFGFSNLEAPEEMPLVIRRWRRVGEKRRGKALGFFFLPNFTIENIWVSYIFRHFYFFSYSKEHLLHERHHF